MGMKISDVHHHDHNRIWPILWVSLVDLLVSFSFSFTSC